MSLTLSLIQNALPAIALYSVALAWVQWQRWRGFLPLGGLFALIFLIAPPPQAAALPDRALVYWQLLAVPAGLLIAPVFLAYIRALTAEGRPARLSALHALPAALGGLAVMGWMALPAPMQAALTTGPDLSLSLPATLVVATLNLLTMLTYLQWLIYGAVVYRQLHRYRARLRDIYASTDRKELLWIGWIMGLFALYAASGLILHLIFSIFEWLDEAELAGNLLYRITSLTSALVALSLVMLLGLWGLRQRPGLARPATPNATPPARKYRKSALSHDDQARITAKLERAMRDDHLHRDPELSLWRLSDHLGVSPNYLSQTLNEHIEQSFFDYVNGWRVADAKTALATGNLTVTQIAFDVGFNSRSAFYTAFKRATGQTPSAFRTGAASG